MTANREDIAKDLFPEKKAIVPFFMRRSVIGVMIGLCVLFTVLLYFLTMSTMNHQVVDLYDQGAGDNQLKKDLFIFLVLGIPVLGFVIGLLVTLLPYKNISYWRKYVPFSLVTILGTQFFLLAIRLADLIILMN